MVAASTLRGSTSIEIFGVRREPELPAQRAHQRAHLVVRQERRRAAAPVQLDHRRRALDQSADDADLLLDVADVLGGVVVVLGDDLVARAVVADRVAERHVHVQRQRRRDVARRQRVDVVGGREAVVEAVRRRIRRVARADAVVLAHQRFVEGDGCGGGRQGRGHVGSGIVQAWAGPTPMGGGARLTMRRKSSRKSSRTAFAEQRIRVVEKGRVDLRPIGRRQVLLRQRNDFGFLAAHVVALEGDVGFDRRREHRKLGAAALLVADQRLLELPQLGRPGAMLRLQPVDEFLRQADGAAAAAGTARRPPSDGESVPGTCRCSTPSRPATRSPARSGGREFRARGTAGRAARRPTTGVPRG